MKMLRLGLVVASGLALFLLAPIRADEQIAVPDVRATDIDQRLKSIVVSVDFNNATIEQAIQALTVKSQRADPFHKGVVFLIEPEASAEATKITLKLDKVPLGETVRYVCLLSDARFKITDKLIRITPKWGIDDGLVSRTFHVDPSFVENAQQAGVIPSPTKP